LADIEEEKLRPLLIELDKAVNKEKGTERWVTFAINIVAGVILFALGIWLGPKLTDLLSHKEIRTNHESKK
jgi:hypothetical protein